MNRAWLALKRAVFVGKNVSIGSRFHIGILSYLGATNLLKVGDDVYIGKFCTIQCNGEIGNGTLIANNVGIVGRRDHDIKDVGKLISKAAWIGRNKYLQVDPRNHIYIGRDVWIGYGSTILSGISIGNGAIVAAGSVVVHSVDEYDIVAGNPARKIGTRFSVDEIRLHEQIIYGKSS